MVAVAWAGCGLAQAASPVLEDPLSKENGVSRVAPKIPVGKTLVLPLLASDADGEVLSLTVSSSNPKIMARVRSGCPVLKIHASYAGDPNALDGDGSPAPSAAFEGDMEFQLFRDATPLTSGIIGGAAQAGFYDNLIFHRVIPGFIIQGGDPAGTGSGNPGFTFRHEFRPELIFSGRGQLAMANSNGGYERGTPFSSFIQLGSFDPTNSSQFFVTTGQPRHLDFMHTIFGQLVRGFDVLEKVSAVPRGTGDKPTVPVKMVPVGVKTDGNDATLLLSAQAPGTATLTVTATDPAGNKAVRTIAVQAKKDTVNDPPLLRPVPALVSPVGVSPSLNLSMVDLERDYPVFGIASANGGITKGTVGTAQIARSFNPRNSAGLQHFAVGVAGFNDPRVNATASAANPFAPFDAYRFQGVDIGYGDRAIVSEARPVTGTAAAGITGEVLAEFQDADSGGLPTDFVATVNWGDGSAQEQNIDAVPHVTIEPSPTRPGAFVVRGSHTYAKAGVYLVEVIVDSTLGATATTLGQASIAAAGQSLQAAGVEVKQVGAALKSRIVATFSDATAGVIEGDFSARVDWGDGKAGAGKVRQVGAGRFVVEGSHTYADPETFAVNVHIARQSPTPATAVAWSRVSLSGFNAPAHLPPFDAAHLVGQFSTVRDANGVELLFKDTQGKGADSVTRFTVSIVIFNSGNLPSKAGKIRFYLSKDGAFNKDAVDRPGTANDTPADIPLKIGTFEEGLLPALEPNTAVSYSLAPASGTTPDLRLTAPAGQTGSGYFILAHFDYSDPLIDQMPASKDVLFGRINGILVNKRSLAVTEAPTQTPTASFTVVLDGKPSADVKLKLALSPAGDVTADKTELVFTPDNWSKAQKVTVSAVNDTTKDGTKTTLISIGPAESTDTAWAGMDGGSVRVVSLDDEP